MSKNKKTPSRAEVKRNEREAKRKKSFIESDGTRTTWERVLWFAGLFILLFSLYMIISSVSYLFTWRNDVSVLSTDNLDAANVFGRSGAYLAHALMG